MLEHSKDCECVRCPLLTRCEHRFAPPERNEKGPPPRRGGAPLFADSAARDGEPTARPYSLRPGVVDVLDLYAVLDDELPPLLHVLAHQLLEQLVGLGGVAAVHLQ